MRIIYKLFNSRWLVISGLAWGASAPYIGYVYPAGGQQGAMIRVTVGGQHINGVKDIYISGTGVSAAFISYEGAGGPLNEAQRDLLRKRIKELDDRFNPAPAPPASTPVVPAPAASVIPANLTATPATPTTPPAPPLATTNPPPAAHETTTGGHPARSA